MFVYRITRLTTRCQSYKKLHSNDDYFRMPSTDLSGCEIHSTLKCLITGALKTINFPF